MKSSEVNIGGTYLAKVTDKLVAVRIDRESQHGGWEATNMSTNKKVRIKSAQRLRGRAPGRGPTAVEAAAVAQAIGHAPVNAPKATDNDTGDGEVQVFRATKGGSYRWRRGSHVDTKGYMARSQAERAAAKANPGATVRFVGEPTPAAGDTKPKTQGDTGQRGATRGQPKANTAKRMSLLDAAAKVLTDASQPLTTKQMIELITTRGLWSSPNGKTPSATLYSAILRELKIKADEARFAKVERGQFTVNDRQQGATATSQK